MLRRLKKFAICSSVIVAGQASRALDDAPFAGQDESEDAKGLLRRLSECEDASYVQIFDRSLDYNEIDTIPTEIGELTALEGLRVPRRPRTPGAGARDRPSTASQVPRQQQDQRPDPDRDRPAHGAGGAASSPASPTPGAARDRASAS
ncbi:hypothetical protein SO694_00054285 [Aureococcus anophagefferens]|uniref:PS II complex 12 kDa extrinsic protein n=1 Tax=Aureococcus anophagefferens TaxID=44056 RepID=A0ABR1FXR2_AURAN